jgi:hypothetical protein
MLSHATSKRRTTGRVTLPYLLYLSAAIQAVQVRQITYTSMKTQAVWSLGKTLMYLWLLTVLTKKEIPMVDEDLFKSVKKSLIKVCDALEEGQSIKITPYSVEYTMNDDKYKNQLELFVR